MEGSIEVAQRIYDDVEINAFVPLIVWNWWNELKNEIRVMWCLISKDIQVQFTLPGSCVKHVST